MNPPEGEETHSQAYYVIKAAQEREELQRGGDELDTKIKKAEKEIRCVCMYGTGDKCVTGCALRAMDNTLLLMNSRNTLQRKSLSKVVDSSK